MKPILKFYLLLTLITGIVYPFLITGISQLAFSHQANGSLIYKNDQPIGSLLIGQLFKEERYFWGRPSASDYGTLPSQGSNLSPASKKLWQTVQERIEHLEKAHGKEHQPPADLVYASASGIDPDLTAKGALYQLDRITKARNLNSAQAKKLKEFIELGERIYWRDHSHHYLNLLRLNLTLDEIEAHEH
jgi:K+-transporting ATPase ATPase C chain